MSLPVQELRGITGSVADALKAQGLSNSETLLEATKTATLRRQLAAAVGVETSVILDLANRADLNRISGIGGVTAICWKKPESIRLRNCRIVRRKTCTLKSMKLIRFANSRSGHLR
jgi:hypothetical protein